MTSIRPVIMCGGSGKRLWPLSRESYPKQFTHLVSETETMLQASVRRVVDAGGKKPILLTGNEYRFVVSEQMEQMGVRDRDTLIEPAGRNTAPAICAAVVRLAKVDPGAIMVISPADHHIRNEAAFAKALDVAVAEAQSGKIVTFGIVPDRPETGYGYIELSSTYKKIKGATAFIGFTEKPDEARAKEMLASQKYLWNSGIFVASVQTLLSAFEKHAGHILATVRSAMESGQDDLDFYRIGPEFHDAGDISIDYAIMEKVEGSVVPLDCGWNDLGSWETVWRESEKGEKGTALKGSATCIGCEDSMLMAVEDKMHVVGIGLKNIAAIAMRDAVLVADMSNSQAVSEAVTQMRKLKIAQADEFPRAFRPWGSYETLLKRARFHVKEIIVRPNQILSLQSHVHRAEHWVVVAGTAKVTIDDEVKMVTENQSVFIPLGAIHRMENPGKVDLHIVEVQTGAYLEEDDIIRYEDVYARN